MKNVIALVAVSGIAAVAAALPQAPVLTWTVSTDGGTTWSNNAVLASAGSVMVRGQLSWGDSGSGAVGLGFASTQFDGALTGLDAVDGVTNIARAFVPIGPVTTAVWTSFGTTGKIDSASDALAAGAGTGWVANGQGIPDALGPSFNSSNPITIMTYDFNIGGADHTATLGAIMNGVNNRAVSIYLTSLGGTSGGGQFSRNQVTVQTATVELLTPTPGSLALLGLGGLAAARRRR